MNFLPTFITTYSHLWWLIPLVILASIAKTPWFKGNIGELIIRLSAKFFLDKNTYLPIHNLTIKTLDGTTQIDHLFVSIYGVFIIETKNYSGWIFGSENQPTWTQKIYKTTNRFQNPLRQNFKHVKAIESLINIPIEKIFSVIVFVGGSTFKTTMPEHVTHAGGYIRYIKSKTKVIFTESEVKEIFHRISSERLQPSFATNREHIKNLKLRNHLDSKLLCPKCGSQMLLKTVKSGKQVGSQFWSCSQFPKCRSTKKID